METVITGKAYVLGDNIDTDQIIPAQYLSFNPSHPRRAKVLRHVRQQRRARRPGGPARGQHAVRPQNEFKSEYTIIIGGKNFGCGSSREHAPLAWPRPASTCVIAEFYARIFFRNSVNGGYLVPLESTSASSKRSAPATSSKST